MKEEVDRRKGEKEMDGWFIDRWMDGWFIDRCGTCSNRVCLDFGARLLKNPFPGLIFEAQGCKKPTRVRWEMAGEK